MIGFDSRAARWFVFAFVVSLHLGCHRHSSPTDTAPGGSATTVSVAAAADLRFAFDKLIAEFHNQEPGIHVQVTYGSSGNFFAQLSNQAPFDIYFSADVEYPRRLAELGLADRESLLVYAFGQLVVAVPKRSTIDVEQLGMSSVLDSAARKVAIANPDHAPYGRAAVAAMKHFGVFDQVRERLVLGENIAQAAQFVESGAADVGVIALSLTYAREIQDQSSYKHWLVPMDAYPTMEQGCVVLNWAKDRQATDRFRDFVAGPRGREVLTQFGFVLPEE